MSATTSRAEDLFARHLDLGGLRGRRHGLVHCLFHADKTASLSVDLDRGLFHCFACDAQGGVVKFAELVGEQAPERRPTATWESPLDQARREILAEARRQPWFCENLRLLYSISDAIRARYRAVHFARQIATAAGDRPEAWRLLETAALVERQAQMIETQFDEPIR